jgi:hypothetical protein
MASVAIEITEVAVEVEMTGVVEAETLEEGVEGIEGRVLFGPWKRLFRRVLCWFFSETAHSSAICFMRCATNIEREEQRKSATIVN